MLHLAGTFTALVTPFRNGVVDYDRLRTNVDAQLAAGVDGLVPCGTTGESPTLSHEEHRLVIEKTIEFAAGRGTIIAGTGSNATSEALSLTRHAADVGAHAALMVNPYYNKPSQEGLYRHFMTVADAVDLPVVLYNIPGRTNITMTPETVERLAKHPHIVADKEATGSIDIASEIKMRCGDDFAVLSGDDSLTLPLMSVGASGVISVLTNLLPERVVELVKAASDGDFDTARQKHLALFPLFKAMLTLAVNPVTIKTALHLAGRDTGEIRLPLCEMPPEDRATLKTLLQKHVPEAVGV